MVWIVERLWQEPFPRMKLFERWWRWVDALGRGHFWMRLSASERVVDRNDVYCSFSVHFRPFQTSTILLLYSASPGSGWNKLLMWCRSLSSRLIVWGCAGRIKARMHKEPCFWVRVHEPKTLCGGGKSHLWVSFQVQSKAKGAYFWVHHDRV